jgi:hypothetical protein
MSCDFTEQVSLLIDAELPANEAASVERHVITCFECQEARAVFLNLRREISDYEITLDPRAQERVLAEILANRGAANPRQIATITWRERFVAAFAFPRFATALATVLILVGLAGFMIYRNAQREPAVAMLPTNAEQPASDRAASPTAPVPEPSREAVEGTLTSNDKKPGTSSKRDTARRAPATQRMRGVPSPSLRRPQTNSAPAFVLASAGTKSNGGLVSSADPETLTARHVEQSSLLLRAFRNAHVEDSDEFTYEVNRARKLLYQNILLRREATTKGNVQVASLLDSLEPILIDIANLQASPAADEVRTIQQRMERKNLVPLLQVNATQLARALD